MRVFGKPRSALVLSILLVAGTAQATDTSDLDPAAVARLQKMGAYLRSLNAFQVDAVTTDEDVLDDGQKVQHSGTTMVLARKPNRMRAEVASSRQQRLFLYDGSHFTLFAQRLGYYATIPAPSSTLQLATKLVEDYDFSLPLEDLFFWGASGWDSKSVKDITDIGPSEVGGTTCEQYALRQDDVDWQIWIQKGEYPLPRKIVITTRTDEARPQHTAIYTWNLAPSFNEASFVFSPPPGAQRVVLPTVASAKK